MKKSIISAIALLLSLSMFLPLLQYVHAEELPEESAAEMEILEEPSPYSPEEFPEAPAGGEALPEVEKAAGAMTREGYISVISTKRNDKTYGFLYNDTMLLEDPNQELTDLTKASAALSEAAYASSNAYVVDYLTQMGFENISDYNSYGARSLEDCDHVGFTIASKQINGRNAHVVVIRSTYSNCEWFSNFNLGKNNYGMHLGFRLAAEEVARALNSRLGGDTAPIIWFTGHSRGAAVANILAGSYTKHYPEGSIFGYTFACPSVSKQADTSLTNIYNYNNTGDLIPMLPLESWGYKRNGQTRNWTVTMQVNLAARYQELTGETFASLTSGDHYKALLQILLDDNSQMRDESKFWNPKVQLFLNLAAYGLGGKNEVSFTEFAAHFGLDQLKDTFLNKIKGWLSKLGIGAQEANEESATLRRLQQFIVSHETEVNNMTPEEFQDFKRENSKIILEIMEFTGEQIEDKTGYKGAVAFLLKNASTIENAMEAIFYLGLFTSENGSIADTIGSGHNMNGYMLAVNARYFGRYGCSGAGASGNVLIPDNVATIGEYCFANSSVQKVFGCNNLKFVGSYAFQNCSSLDELHLGESLIELDTRSLSGCSALETLTIPDSVRFLGAGCLPYQSLQSLTIPFIGETRDTQVTSIGWLFGNSSSRSSFYHSYDESGSPQVATFASPTNLKEIHVTDQVRIPDFAFNFLSNLTTVTLSEKTTAIGPYAFYYCTKLSNFTLPEALTEIGKSAFYNCDALTEVTIPAGVTVIPEYTYRECDNIASVSLPQGLQSIGKHAFYGCSALKTLTIPDSVQSLGEGCLPYQSLQSLTIPFIGETRDTQVTSIGWLFGQSSSYSPPYHSYSESGSPQSATFYRPQTLTEIHVTDQVRIPDFAFNFLSNLTTVTLSEKTTAIGPYAFYYCTKLSNITLPGTVTEIGKNAFASSGLQQVSYPCSMLWEFLEPQVAEGNEKLTTAQWVYTLTDMLTLPGMLTELEADAFAGIGTQMVILPETVTAVGAGAFGGNETLQYLFIPGMTTELAEGVLAGSSQAAVVCCEGSTAHQWCLDNNVRAIVKR